jgi:hypothetical protein
MLDDQSLSTSILNILHTGLLILGTEVLGAVPCQPCAEFADFFPETLDRLGIHVCLGNQFGHVDWVEVFDVSGESDADFGDENIGGRCLGGN